MKKLMRLFTVLVAVSMLAAACGSSGSDDGDANAGKSDDTSSTTAGEAPTGDLSSLLKEDPLSGTKGSGLTRGVTDSSVKLGCIISDADYAGFAEGARARFQRANDEGGVNGREIDFDGCSDTGGDQQAVLNLTKQMTQQDKAFGLLTAEGVIPQAAFDFLGQQQVPYTGWGFLPGFCGTRWGFGWNGCLSGNNLPDAVPHAVVQANLAKAILEATGMKGPDVKLAIQGFDSVASTSSEKQYREVYKDVGAEIVYVAHNIPSPGPTTDYSPFVRPLLAANPNLVMMNTAFSDIGGFMAALRAAGYDGPVFNFVTYIPGLLDSSPQLAQALDGSYVVTSIVPQEEQSPYIKQMEKDLVASKAKSGDVVTFGGAIGYNEADLWVGLLEATGEKLDTKTFDEAVNVEGVKIAPSADGGIGTTNWPESHFIPTDCGAVVQIKDGKYVSANDFTCYDSPRIR